LQRGLSKGNIIFHPKKKGEIMSKGQRKDKRNKAKQSRNQLRHAQYEKKRDQDQQIPVKIIKGD